MKKLISIILSICTVFAMTACLSGCGSKGGSDDSLVWYIIGDKPADHDKIMAKANEIIEPAIGMKLDMQYMDSASYEEKIKLKMASNEAFDLCFTGYVNSYNTAVDLGGLYDITDLIEETGLDEVIPEFYLDSAKVEGSIYGIPNIQVVSNPAVVQIKQSIADETGTTDIFNQISEISSINASYEDLEEIMSLYDDAFAKIKAQKPEMYVWNPNVNLGIGMAYEEVVPGVAIRRDGTSTKFVNMYETKEWQLGSKKTNEWYKKGYIRNDVASKGTTYDTNERALLGASCTTWKPGQDSIDMQNQGELNLYVDITKPYVPRTGPLATMISVGADTKHPKEAVEFIKLINTNKELYNLICWGIEGEHYNVNDDGTVTVIEDCGYDSIGQSAWKYGNQFNSFVMEGQPADVWEQTEKMNNEAVKSPMLGFVPNTDNISVEMGNISNVISNYKARCEYGTGEFDEWYPTFIKELKTAGLDKVISEIQTQYDSWLKTR